jgi:DeoR family transcriptional regulator, copper-sensing transcriptional repressor
VKTATERQRYILARLEKRDSLAISEIRTQLGVSAMTVNRDVNKLAEAGLITKSRGEVLRVNSGSTRVGQSDNCALCGGTLSAHDMMLVAHNTGERQRTCCPHCGLMLLLRSSPDVTALTLDFITHHMVDARQAVYVVESTVTICCSPGILSFSSPEAADEFRRGFGGVRIDFQEALAYVQGVRPAHHAKEDGRPAG